MSKRAKTFFIACAVAFGLGLFLTCVGLATGGVQAFSDGFIWNNGKFVKMERNIEAGEQYYDKLESIDISAQDSNIVFEPTDDNRYRIEYTYYEQTGEPEITISGDRLTIKEKFKIGKALIGWNFEKTERYIKVYYPKNADFDNIKISSEFGEVDMAGFKCDYCNIAMDNGDLTMMDIRTDNLTVDNEYGDIDIMGTLLKKTNITSEDGDVILNLIGVRGHYWFSLVAEYGNMNFADSKVMRDDPREPVILQHGLREIYVNCEYGDVNVSFLGDIYGES